MEMQLPADPAERKAIPLCSGVLDYFPLAIAEVARISKAGNDQHHAGKPLHWALGKSADHADCIARHLIDRGTLDTSDNPPLRHSTKLAWRALALLQEELMAERDAALVAAGREPVGHPRMREIMDRIARGDA